MEESGETVNLAVLDQSDHQAFAFSCAFLTYK
jgi:hypothetical protein